MKNKLLILVNQSYFLFNFCYHLLCDFKKTDAQVIALAPPDAYFDKAKIAFNNIGVTMQPMQLSSTGLNPLQDVRFFLRLFSYLRKEKPNIAFFRTTKPVIYGCLAAKYARIPKIYAMVSGLGYLFIGASYKQRILRPLGEMLYRLALANANKVFFHNQDDAELFKTLRIVRPEQVVVTPGSGVDTEYFSPLPYPKTLTFLFVGRLIRDKGIFEFVAAAKQIKREYQKVRFLIAGGLYNGPSALLQSALDELIQDGAVEYLGEVADIRVALQQASVFVLPSYREGLSRAALEALATARPIITTDVPGCREVVPTNSNGLKVPIYDIQALATAMRYFVNHPEAIATMGMAGRDLAVQRFAVEKVNRIILKAMDLIE